MRRHMLLPFVAAGALAAVSVRADSVQGELGTKVDEYLRRLAPFGFSGAVLIAKDGQVVLEKGYGWANREKKIPFTGDTISPIGSITKQFTGAAILKLEMMGRLRTDDAVAKHLPDVPADKAGITIHHLLTHTSGIAPVPGGDDDPISRDDLVRQALALPLAEKPGARFRYSNEGFSLAAAIVERVSGVSYEEFLHEHLFKPAGMQLTGYALPKWPRDRMAHGYDVQGRDVGTFESRNWGTKGPGWHLVGNGGILSTPRDMYRWHLALAGDGILSKAAKEKYYSPYVLTDAGDYYGYGWGVLTTPRRTKLVTHNGGNGIFFSDFKRYLDENIVVFAASNGEIRATMLGDSQLPGLVFGVKVPMPPAVVTLEPARLQTLAGTYRTREGETLRVSVDRGRLHLASPDARLLAVLASLSPPGSPRYSTVESRTKAILESASKGDYRQVFEAFGGQVPLARIQEQEGGLWRQMGEEHGAFKTVTILGSAQQGAGARVVANLEFQRGSVSIVYVWEGQNVAGIRVRQEPPGSTFLPQSETQFVRFSLRDPDPFVIRFIVGETTEAILPGPAGEIRAARLP